MIANDMYSMYIGQYIDIKYQVLGLKFSIQFKNYRFICHMKLYKFSGSEIKLQPLNI